MQETAYMNERYGNWTAAQDHWEMELAKGAGLVVKRCICCDLPEESCGQFIEERRRKDAANERSQRLSRSGWFPANYDGTCGMCGEHFTPGTPITGMSNGHYRCCGD